MKTSLERPTALRCPIVQNQIKPCRGGSGQRSAFPNYIPSVWFQSLEVKGKKPSLSTDLCYRNAVASSKVVFSPI